MASALPPIGLEAGSPGFTLATDLIVISILLSGLAIGLGRALGSRRLWAWGAEELAQALINAALLGVLVAGVAGMNASLEGALPPGSGACVQAMPEPRDPLPLALSRCRVEEAAGVAQNASAALLQSSYRLGWLASAQVDLDGLSATPYRALDRPSMAYADWAQRLAGTQAALAAQAGFLRQVSSGAFGLLLPLGFLLRLLPFTRRLGGALIAGAIGAYVAYPLAYAALTWGWDLPAAGAALGERLEALDGVLALVPQADWSRPGALASRILELSGRDLAARAADPYAPAAALMGELELAAMAYPLVALALAALCAWELSGALGGEFRLDLFEQV